VIFIVLTYLANILFHLRSVTVSFNYYGKIVLKVRDEESKKVVVPAQKKVLAVPKTFVDPEKTYAVIGACNLSTYTIFKLIDSCGFFLIICH
jgi:hypothetical protein